MVSALMAVAHPDDETIWAGGLLQRKKNWDWTIFSFCRASDADRKPKFEKACRLYNADFFIADLEDTLLGEIENKKVEKLLAPIEKKRFDFVFTHGANGEYGHIRHRDAHKAVLNAVKEKKILCKRLFVFSYKKGKGFEIVPDEKAGKKIILSEKELEAKRKIVAELYGYSYGSPDVQYCTSTEAFSEVKF
ncbi:MAG TPA: PIG-L family deacetylase [archaeon]|nr:PIG-L family deacetylase [archaeon]